MYYFTSRKLLIKTISVVILLILIGGVGHFAKAEECFIVAPYVVHANHNSAKVVWVTPAGMEAGSVTIQKTDGSDQQTFDAELSTPQFHDIRIDGDLDHLRHLALLENLKPHTRYNYQVQCGDNETTSSGTFKTAPTPGDRVPFEFVAVADGHAMSRYRRISEPVGELLPSFVVHVGDLRGGRGHDWDRWETYFDVARPYLESSVFVPVVGGHDVRPARNFRALFAFNDPLGNPSREDNTATYYTKTYGNLMVVVLDHVYQREEQLEWLEKALSESETEWIIVFNHSSYASVGGNGSALAVFGGITDNYTRMFEKHGVDVVITAHDHIYERRLPFGSDGVKPVHHITINSNGNHRRVRPSPIVEGGIGRRVHTYSHFTINGNHLEMNSIDFDGNVIDRLELIKDIDGMYQEEVMNKAVDLDLARILSHIYTGQSVVEDLRYERRDIEAAFKSSVPKGGENAILKLNTGYSGDDDRDVHRFPIGSELIVYAQDDPDGWQTEKQVIEVTGNTAEVSVTAPEGLIYDENGLNIPLELHLNIRVNGREFEPVTVRPTLLETGEVGKVQLIQPANNETVMDEPVLKWNEALHASDYQLQIGNPDLSEIFIDTVLSDTRYEFTETLPEGKSYAWRVRGRNKFEGDWSGVFMFFIYRETEREDIDEISFSNSLRPAVSVLDLPEVSTGSTGRGFRGTHSMFTWVESDKSLTMNVTGGTITQYQDRGNVQIYLFSYHENPPEKVDFDDSVPPDGETYEITLESPHTGKHELEWDDGNDRTYLKWPEGHPMTIRASKSHPFSFQRDFNLYFYVPEGTETVGGHITNHSNTRFFDGEGNERSGWQNPVEDEGYFSIPVPHGQDNTLWRITANRNTTLSLMTVPPYLARNEKELLLPAEVLGLEPTGSENHKELPDEIELGQNFPNPFNPSTRITYSVPDPTRVHLTVYNVIGQRVATLVSENKPAGRYEVIFDASGLSSGIYLYQLRTDTHTLSRQMLLVK